MKSPSRMTREELEEEVAYLRGELGLTASVGIVDAVKVRFGMIPCAARFVVALYQAKGRILSLDQISAALPVIWRVEDQNSRYMKSIACRARKCMGGAAIRTVYAQGYSLTPIGIALVDEALGVRRAA